MSESTENTPEYVAYLLTQDIAGNEGMRDRSENFRKDLLDLYAESLQTVQGKRK